MSEIKERREKFKELAENRVNKVLQTLKLIGNLSNTRHYEYNDNDIKKIFSALESELKSAKQKFTRSSTSNGVFNLD